jgi:predicted nucleic acid-binding protein
VIGAYDAVYVALAQLLDVPLLTRDRRLAAANWSACAHRARVKVREGVQQS